ncbi:MAG: PBP1A family penicillin-binding protein [Alphaproteobacteria bacterium]|nr:PBP1A family penicillin-binding protein [Alphaproteobacteria bacterium]
MAKKKKTTSKRKSPARKTSKRAQKPSLFKGLIKWGFVAALWGGLFLMALFAWYAAELPDITSQATFERKTSITVEAADGSVITRYGEIHGNSVEFEDIPPNLIYAVIAIEDRRFYNHFGIDLLGFTRAMFVNAREMRFAQGGSTITQQLAKNLFLSRERTIKRKIQEAMLALWLERELSKDEIITAYLNRVYMGSGAYGADAAAMLYFDKDLKDIDLREAATLAGLLKAPSRYSPLSNPELSRQRADVVIGAMVDAGYVDQEQADHLQSIPPPPPQSRKNRNNARYYTDWIVDGLDELIGTPNEDIIVRTTMNPAIQTLADNALSDAIDKYGEEKAFSQGAVVVMRPDGTVLALVGGYDYRQSQFNRVTQALRQPGSSFKPIIYLTALENGWEPNSLIVDEPITSGRYRPKNFGGKYLGEVTLEEALLNSLNTVSLQLTKDVGVGSVIGTARRLGIISPLQRDLSLALGTSSISPLELATAYAVIANGGLAVYPYGITKITNEEGELYYQRPYRRKTRRVVSSEYIDKLTFMMSSVIKYGTGRGAAVNFPVAGKTGTSQDSRDAWFSGFSNELVTTVWIGNDDNTPMKAVTGGSYPAQIWRSVMAGSRGIYSPVSSSEFATSTFDALISGIISPTRSGGALNRGQGQNNEIDHRATSSYNN